MLTHYAHTHCAPSTSCQLGASTRNNALLARLALLPALPSLSAPLGPRFPTPSPGLVPHSPSSTHTPVPSTTRPSLKACLETLRAAALGYIIAPTAHILSLLLYPSIRHRSHLVLPPVASLPLHSQSSLIAPDSYFYRASSRPILLSILLLYHSRKQPRRIVRHTSTSLHTTTYKYINIQYTAQGTSTPSPSTTHRQASTPPLEPV